MTQPKLPTTLALAAAVAFAVPPSLAQAQGYYFPPKLLKQGKATTPYAGPGTVIVKVLVNPDASFKVQGIIKSTNHGDDQPALEIARTSKYKPATRGNKPVLAFYDFSLKFTGTSVSSGTEPTTTTTSGSLGQYERMMVAGNYAGAKSGLTQYLAVHPGDQQASALLGVADTHLSDFAGAVKAFDSAGTLPSKDAAVAGHAYAQYAQEEANAKNPAAAMAAAKKAVQYEPSVVTYNVLGTAEQVNGDYSSAAATFEKARTMAAGDSKITAHSRAVIASNLAAAYASAGDLEKAKAAAAEALKLDPSVTTGQSAVALSFYKKGEDLEKAGKMADAAAQFEAGAQVSPADAVTLYSRAALAYLNVKPNPDNVRAKADADKALAIDPNNARANLYEGVALANQGNTKDALTYLNKADAAAKAANDSALIAQIESAIKQLSGAK
jgi:tetratricopeptide (TPR) repeat protein